MTPGERWKWAQRNRVNAKLAVYDAIEAAELAEMEWHYARFIFVASSAECPTCQAPAGAFCGLWRLQSGEIVARATGDEWRTAKLVALFLHPSRTTTAEARAAAMATPA